MRLGSYQYAAMLVMATLVSETVCAEFITTQDWWGSVGVGQQRRMDRTGTTEIMSQLTADVNNKYYIWQPWFLTGKMRLVLTNDVKNIGGTESESTNVGGEITANVLPLSRFPMTLGLSQSDNSINYERDLIDSSGQVIELGDATNTTRFFITQKYLGKRTTVSASYHLDDIEGDNTGQYTSTRRELELVRRDPHSDLTMKLQAMDSLYDQSGEERNNELALLTHNFYPSERLNVSTFASKVAQEDYVEFGNSGVLERYNHDLDQVSSTLIWRSSDRKLSVNSGVRYTGVLTEQQASKYENIDLNMSAGAQYKFNELVSATASASYGQSEINGTQGNTLSYLTSLNYRSKTIDIADYKYGWGSKLSYSNTEYETDDPVLSTEESVASISANHFVMRTWTHGRKGQIRFNADQGANYQQLSDQDDKVTLNHGLRVGYSNSERGGTHYAQASYTENRDVNATEEISQQLTIQYSRQKKLSMNSSLNGSATHQETVYQDSNQNTRSGSSTVTLNYMMVRNFSFQTLSFSSGLSYSQFFSNTSDDVSRFVWDNSAKHQIGQLSSSLTVRIESNDDAQKEPTSALIIVNVKRKF